MLIPYHAERFGVQGRSATFRLLHPAKVLCSASLSERDASRVPPLNPKIEGETMFGLVMVLALVIVTVVPPVGVMATARAKSRRK